MSYDGYLYFSALEKIDQGNYSCSVQSSVSNNGRNGPFFQLKVTPHPNYQQLRFPQNFPKGFPEAPVAGKKKPQSFSIAVYFNLQLEKRYSAKS